MEHWHRELYCSILQKSVGDDHIWRLLDTSDYEQILLHHIAVGADNRLTTVEVPALVATGPLAPDSDRLLTAWLEF